MSAQDRRPYRVCVPPELEKVLRTFPEPVRKSLHAQLARAAEKADTDFPPTPDWLSLMGKRPPVLTAMADDHGLLYNADEEMRTLNVRGVLVPKGPKRPPRRR